MLCDFTAGVKVVSFLNLVTLGREKVPRYSGPQFPPPGSELCQYFVLVFKYD